MDVKLSIVGFFSEIRTLSLTVNQAKPTVKDVLEAFKAVEAAKHVPFHYAEIPSPYIPGRNLVFSFSYKGFTLASVISNLAYAEERVWQFYLVDSSEKVVSNAHRVPFDQFPVTDGSTVIWRLVTVLKTPGSPKRVKQGAVPATTLIFDDRVSR